MTDWMNDYRDEMTDEVGLLSAMLTAGDMTEADEVAATERIAQIDSQLEMLGE